jgi:hypothetical protein
MVAADIVASGHTVLVDLWDQWPGRRLPPMPDLSSSSGTPPSTTVGASLGGFPGADELPVPDQALTSVGPTISVAGTQLRRPSGARSGDASAESDSDIYPLLALRDFDVWNTWPTADALPVPEQVVGAAAVTVSAPEDEPAAVVADAGPTSDDGATPIETDAALVLAIALGPLFGPRKGRALLMGAAQAPLRSLRFGWRALRPGPWLRHHSLRSLAVLRLVLGILRIW